MSNLHNYGEYFSYVARRILRNEKKCKAATGLSLEQFKALADVFSQ
jgi:hypothetical protein